MDKNQILEHVNKNEKKILKKVYKNNKKDLEVLKNIVKNKVEKITISDKLFYSGYYFKNYLKEQGYTNLKNCFFGYIDFDTYFYNKVDLVFKIEVNLKYDEQKINLKPSLLSEKEEIILYDFLDKNFNVYLVKKYYKIVEKAVKKIETNIRKEKNVYLKNKYEELKSNINSFYHKLYIFLKHYKNY